MQKHNKDIQVLRALAILLVLVHHGRHGLFASLSPQWERFFAYFFGTSGVDLFLVISGFVVSRSFLATLSVTPASDALRIFWLKRIYRILPAAWFWLGLVLLLTIFVNESGAFGSIRSAVEGAIAAVMNVANVRLADCFQQLFECGPTTVYWSLSLEEQFYLLLPILILVSGRFIPYLLMAFVLTQIVIVPLTLPDTFRSTGLALGVILGWYSNTAGYRTFFIGAADRNKARLFFAVLCICLAVTLHPALNIVSMRLGYQLVAIISAIMVYMASMEQINFAGTGRIRSLLCWIGDRSYSLYLSHMPALYLCHEIFHYLPAELLEQVNRNATAAILYFTLSVTGAALSYRYLEQPFLRAGRSRIAGLMPPRVSAPSDGSTDTPASVSNPPRPVHIPTRTAEEALP